jgi:hypothetical protein
MGAWEDTSTADKIILGAYLTMLAVGLFAVGVLAKEHYNLYKLERSLYKK